VIFVFATTFKVALRRGMRDIDLRGGMGDVALLRGVRKVWQEVS